MARTPHTTAHKLVLAEQYKLMQFIEAHYAGANQTDGIFAQAAQEKLGFTVTLANVSGARRALGIESNIDRQARERRASLTEPKTRLDRIEVRLTDLEAAFNSLKTQLGA